MTDVKYPFLDLATVNAPYMEELKAAMARVVQSGRYVGGDEVARFEDNLKKLTGAACAVGVSNGLDALRMILRGYIELGRLRPGDGVIVPSNTYIASVLAITDCRLRPVFVDPSIDTFNISAAGIAAALDDGVKAVMTVHLYGRVAWDAAIKNLARERGLIVIEDNAQAIGAVAGVDGLSGGSHVTGSLGHAAAFSFYPTKNIGALGDAGAVTTSDRELAAAVRALANYGSDTRYHNIYQGWNCRLDPLQAAVLNVKLPHVDVENGYRRAIAAVYDEEISHQDIVKPCFIEDGSMVWHQYVVMSPRRDELQAYLCGQGVATDIHYPTPIHRQPCYLRYAGLPLPVADRISKEALSLPVSRCTSVDDARAIARIISEFN